MAVALTMNNQYDHLLQAIESLEQRGFVYSLLFVNGYLYNPRTAEYFGPEELTVIEHHRFEGSGDYDDMAVLYAMEAPDGTKALVIDAYGTYADGDLGDFMRLTKSV